jgi:hypothetical protein
LEPVTGAILISGVALLLLSRKGGASGVPSVVKSPFSAALPGDASSLYRASGFVTVDKARAQAEAHAQDQIRRIQAFKSSASTLISTVDATNASRLRRGIKAADRWLSKPTALRLQSPAEAFERLLATVRASSGASTSSGGKVDQAIDTVNDVVSATGKVIEGVDKVVDAFESFFNSGSAPESGDPMDGKGTWYARTDSGRPCADRRFGCVAVVRRRRVDRADHVWWAKAQAQARA